MGEAAKPFLFAHVKVSKMEEISCKPLPLYSVEGGVCTLHSTLPPDFPLQTLNSTVPSHSQLYTLTSTLEPRKLYIPHSTLYTPHLTLCALHSTLDNPHCTLHTSHHILLPGTYVWAFGFVGFILCPKTVWPHLWFLRLRPGVRGGLIPDVGRCRELNGQGQRVPVFPDFRTFDRELAPNTECIL